MSAIAIGGVAVLDRLAAASQSRTFSIEDLFKGPDSPEPRPDAANRLKDIIQQVQPPGFDCPTQADVTIIWQHLDLLFGEALAAARREALDTELRRLQLPRVDHTVKITGALANLVVVNADTKPDRERPTLETNSVPRKGTKVKAGDQIKVTMVARDHANLWQTGIKTMQLVAETEGGRFIASENFIQTPRVCANVPPEKRLEATYTVPSNPSPIVRLTALAEDFAGNMDIDIGEFPTEGDWYGSITWFFHGKEDTSRGPTESRSETKFDGQADLNLNYDGQGNLTGLLRGSWKVDTMWWGYPHGDGQVCRGSTGATPVKADLRGSYTPGSEAVTLDSVNMEAMVIVGWTGGGPNLTCPPVPIDYSSTLSGLLRSRLTRAADGTYHAEGDSPDPHEFRWSVKLRRAQN
jgi:hypothetical protein